MSERKEPFIPVFGPNGAVMNAPGLGEQLRSELEAQERLQRWPSPVRFVGDIALFVAASAAVWIVFDMQLGRIPFDLFVKLVAAASLIGLGVRLRAESKRWDIRPRLRAEGARLPPATWVLGLLAVDIAGIAVAVAILLSMHPAADAIYPYSRDSAFLLLVAYAFPSSWLRARAAKRGWVI